jgi:hypothetical protein
MRHLPKSYTSKNHETLGSDVLSVLHATTAPEKVFPPELLARLRAVKPDGWYPVSLMHEAVDRLEASEKVTGLKLMGMAIFKHSHAEGVKKTVTSAHQLLHGLDGLYRNANRGQGIGGWRVLSFGAGKAELEKTTPHHCSIEEGLLAQAFATVGCPSLVTQRECVRHGADACTFVVESMVTDHRWTGKRP